MNMKQLPATLALSCLVACIGSAQAANDDAALMLESAPESDATAKDKPAGSPSLRGFVELAAGEARTRPEGHQPAHRLSLDVTYTARLSPAWRVYASDRLDWLRAPEAGKDVTLNSLREAYAGWTSDRPGSSTAVEFGRINLRQGPAYGYNPIDFFRGGSVRAFTTVNPVALRETRLGTVALRGQQSWGPTSLTATYAPKLSSAAVSPDTWSADLGATNERDRLLLTWGQSWGPRTSTQVHLHRAAGDATALGASVSTLLSDAWVGHAEWVLSRERTLAARAWQTTSGERDGQRAAVGVTHTTGARLSWTAEVGYNGFALSREDWRTASSGATGLIPAYLQTSIQRQDQPGRWSTLLYVIWPGGLARQVDLSGFVRVNPQDGSQLYWLEARYHLGAIDLALQGFTTRGSSDTEFGVLPLRSSVQALVTYRF